MMRRRGKLSERISSNYSWFDLLLTFSLIIGIGQLAARHPGFFDFLASPKEVTAERLGPTPLIRDSVHYSLLANSTNATGQAKVLRFKNDGLLQLPGLDELYSNGQHLFVKGENNDAVQLTLDLKLQEEAQKILQRNRVPWGALVALDPHTGKVKAMAGFSSVSPSRGNELALRASFPAASLFKLITAAAAIEQSGLSANSTIKFHGGNYSLGPHNYLPNAKKDRRAMSFTDALGKSCNPVFARIALNNLSENALAQYAYGFGFNDSLPFELNVDRSEFNLPSGDYALARTAAGFGQVYVSPLHAALITASFANEGAMMRPYLVDRVYDRDGKIVYKGQPSVLRHTVLSSTANDVLQMMVSTVTTGTARRYFSSKRKPSLFNHLDVAAKTGTLTGQDPKGVNHWFVAAVPAENPEVVIAALVVDPGNARIKGTGIGREFLEYYFRGRKA